MSADILWTLLFEVTLMTTSLPQAGYLRLSQIIGNPKQGIPAIFPVSKSTWWAGVKTGKYPKPVKLSERCVAWRIEDIRTLL
jgi:hypothetical protein